jgi:hypothetical protein
VRNELCLAKTESAFEINKIQRGCVTSYPSYARAQKEAMKRAIRRFATSGGQFNQNLPERAGASVKRGKISNL